MNATRGNLVLLSGMVLTLAASATGAHAAASPPKYPPCTRRALSAGLTRGTAQPRGARFQGSFGCAGGWAYSGIVVGRRHGFDAVAVYRAQQGVWVVVDRAAPCARHLIPRKIYRGACTTS